MLELPKAMLVDLDDTILWFGDRKQVLTRVSFEFEAELSPIQPIRAAQELEDALAEFWGDQDRYEKWRFLIRESRHHLISEVFEKWQFRANGLTPEVAIRFAEQFHQYRSTEAVLFSGAVEALVKLREQGVLLALVTNGDSQVQRAKIDRFDLAKHFHHVQIEGEMGFGKPNPRAYLHAMSVLGVNAHETWMVGDNLDWEVAAPQRLGIYSVWHDHSNKGLPPGTSIRPDRIIQRISELVA